MATETGEQISDEELYSQISQGIGLFYCILEQNLLEDGKDEFLKEVALQTGSSLSIEESRRTDVSCLAKTLIVREGKASWESVPEISRSQKGYRIVLTTIGADNTYNTLGFALNKLEQATSEENGIATLLRLVRNGRLQAPIGLGHAYTNAFYKDNVNLLTSAFTVEEKALLYEFSQSVVKAAKHQEIIINQDGSIQTPDQSDPTSTSTFLNPALYNE